MRNSRTTVTILGLLTLFQGLPVLFTLATANGKVPAGETASTITATITATIKAITLIEKSDTVIHGEFVIDMQQSQLHYHLKNLPSGIIANTIKVTPTDKQSPQIIQQTLISMPVNPSLPQHDPILTDSTLQKKALTTTITMPYANATSPGLRLQFTRADQQRHHFSLTFQVANVTWQTNTDMNIGNTHGDISTWVSIHNASNAGFNNVKVTLIENTDLPSGQDPLEFAQMGRLAGNHIYQNRPTPAWVKIHARQIPAPVSIPAFGQTKALLYNDTAVTIKRQLIYEGMIRDQQYRNQSNAYQRTSSSYNQRSQNEVWQVIQVLLPANKLKPKPLPSTKLRVYDKRNHLISTQYLARVLPGEPVEVFLNPEKALVANRTQLSFEVVEQDKIVEETYKIDLKNMTDNIYTVMVREYLDRSATVSVVNSTQPPTINGNRLDYLVKVKPGKAVSITYTARYSW